MKWATLCYIRANKQTLMIHRNKDPNDMHKGKWNGLGGKLHAGETPEECVIREVKEESGIDLVKPCFKGFITFPAFDEIDDWYVFVFTASEFKGEMVNNTKEGELEWVDDDRLLSLPLWEGDKIFFKWLEQDRFFSAKFVYQNNRLIEYSVNFYPCNPQD
jgi:8-oxo-dGTP diphosphatase